jgi:AcrR family transcriptional regulator
VTETRRYDSALRSAKTRATRVRILDAARQLFLAGGYVGTTLDAVAARAEVSQQTVYNLVGGKATLFKAVYDVTLVGDDEPIPMAERPEMLRVLASPTARAALEGYASVSSLLWTRVGAFVRIATAQAAAGDPDLTSFVETIEGERATGTRNIVRFLATRFGLRPGLDFDEAVDIVWVLSGPEVLDRMVGGRGWSVERFEEWLVETVHHGLFPS